VNCDEPEDEAARRRYQRGGTRGGRRMLDFFSLGSTIAVLF
jgi:hypothetical protein